MDKETYTIERLPFIAGDRVRLLLVQSGVKPASFIHLFKHDWNPEIPDSYKLPEEVEERLEKELLGIGLHCLRKDRAIPLGDSEVFMQRSLYFGRDEGSLSKLLSAKTDYEFGIACGFPESAIEAYVGKRNRHNGNFPDDVPFDAIRFSEFVKSADNWREELETSQLWSNVVGARSYSLHRAYMRQSPLKK